MADKNGFSLVELSIVLVILGLLVGGVLSGQTLIRAAELRKMTTVVDTTQTALNTFQLKYMAMPGDIKNATAFWGAANTAGTGGECANILANAGTGTQTCNGDGDGYIDLNEHYRLWQHLANAGLVDGSYSGVAGSSPSGSGYQDVAGENIPKAAVNNGVALILGITQSQLDTSYSFNLTQGNYYKFSACCHPTEKLADGAFIRADELWGIDTKMDDGEPYSGKLQAQKGYWSGCTSASAVSATYRLDSSGNNCTYIINLD